MTTNIRAELADLSMPECRVLYGGSVTPDIAASIIAEGGVDGFLVGGASLKAESFLAIVQACDDCYALMANRRS
jgi:triosephosphate isomerase